MSSLQNVRLTEWLGTFIFSEKNGGIIQCLNALENDSSDKDSSDKDNSYKDSLDKDSSDKNSSDMDTSNSDT